MSPRVRVRSTSGQSVLVGTDIIEVERVAQSLRQFGERYISRVYTRDEARYCTDNGADAPRFFAARFAAKEAAMKVLRPAPSDALDWKSIEVVRSKEGWCDLRLSGTARELARRAGLQAFALSMSHEERYATAVVVAERRSVPAPKSARSDRGPKRAGGR